MSVWKCEIKKYIYNNIINRFSLLFDVIGGMEKEQTRSSVCVFLFFV